MRRKLLLSVLSLLIFLAGGYAQNLTVAGKVVDDKGAPIAGASIVQKGANKGASAANDGTFTVVVKKGTLLVVSALGYETKQVEANAASLIITLTTDVKVLSDVVVTGVGAATSKKKLGISVEAVNVGSQVKVATGDIGQQLVGQVAGAQISSTNGNPGRPLNILLRGINTVQGGTSPMILIDGIEARATSLNSIDVNIIERVEVVQGAAAASLYGAQGANGVIQLFTKKAKGGKINIEFSSNATSTELLNIGGVAKNPYHAFVTDANNNVLTGSGAIMALDPATLVFNGDVQYNSLGLTSYSNKPYDANLKFYDLYKMFFQKGYIYNNSVTISGTRDKVDFLLSASNNKQNSNFKDNGAFERSNFTSKLGVELAKNLKLTSLTQLVYTKNTLNDQTGRGIVYAINNARPFAELSRRDQDGNYGTYFGAAVGVNHSNPFYTNQYSSTNINKVDVIQTMNLNYKLNKFVELDAKYSLNYTYNNTLYRYEDQSLNKNATLQNRYTSNYNPNASATTTGEIDNYNQRTTFQNFIGTANFRTDFQKDFNINLPIKTTTTVAYDYRKSNYKQFASYG